MMAFDTRLTSLPFMFYGCINLYIIKYYKLWLIGLVFQVYIVAREQHAVFRKVQLLLGPQVSYLFVYSYDC